MKEQLINFETAKLAREKGFDEKCTHGFNTFEEGHPKNGEFRDLYDRYHGDYSGWKNSESQQGSYVTAPTQTLLQKWLRDVVKTIITIDFYNNGEEWEDTEFIVTVDEFKHFTTHSSFVKADFKTYEEALEVGLQEALKLIEC